MRPRRPPEAEISPLAIFVSMVGVLLVASVLVHVFRRNVTRVCPLCDARVEIGRRRCQVCGYRFDSSRW